MIRTPESFRFSQYLNFAAIGLICICSAVVLTFFVGGSHAGAGKWFELGRDIILHVGITLIAVSMIDLIWRSTGREPMREELGELRESLGRLPIVGDLLSTGLRRIRPRCYSLTSDGFDWSGFLAQATRRIDISGYTLRQWYTSQGFQETLRKKVGEGVDVRILFMDDTNPFLLSLVYSGACQNEEDVSAAIRTGKRFFADLRGECRAQPGKAAGVGSSRGSFEVRMLTRAAIVTCSIVRSDDRVVATHYLYSELAGASPVIECDGSGDFLNVYEKEFETLWRQAEPLACAAAPSAP